MERAVKFHLLAGAFVVCTFAILATQPRAQPLLLNPDSVPSGNRSIDGALNATVAINSPNARRRDKVVLFVTNRRIDPLCGAEGENHSETSELRRFISQ
jgi:hypothetical protein